MYYDTLIWKHLGVPCFSVDLVVEISVGKEMMYV